MSLRNNCRMMLLVMLSLAISIGTADRAYAQQPAWATLMPAKVQRQWYEDHHIYIEVTTAQPQGIAVHGAEHFGNRVGNIVPFNIKVFLLEPQSTTTDERAIEVNFSALRRGQLQAVADADPDWLLADKRVLPPGEVPISVPDAPKAVLIKWGNSQYKAQLWEIKLYAQTMRRAQPLPFSIDFAFARELLPSGGLDWKAISTPEYLVSMSATADKSQDLATGNTQPVPQEKPIALAFALIAVGLTLVFAPAARAIVPALRSRFAKTSNLNPVEEAWRVLKPIFAAAKSDCGYNFNQAQVRDIVRALKRFFNIEAWTVEQLWEHRFDLDDGELLHSVLLPMETGALEMGSTLSADRGAQLVERIERLVPKPV